MKRQTFFQRNSVAIVVIPSLIGIHYAWSIMQKNRTLVTADEEIDLPIVTFAKYCWKRVEQGITGSGESVENTTSPAAAKTTAK